MSRNKIACVLELDATETHKLDSIVKDVLELFELQLRAEGNLGDWLQISAYCYFMPPLPLFLNIIDIRL